jgi:hypothetical protein
MKTKIATFLIICMFSSNIWAQETEKKDSIKNFSLSMDLVTNYIWRGLALSDVPNLQPNIAYTTNNGVFSVGAFGSYALGSSYHSEVDLFTGLTLGKFSVQVWDYFTLNQVENNRYFNYKKDSTSHAFEGVLGFSGPESFPIQLTAGTFFYGNDKLDSINNDYSTYFEVAYPFKWKANNLSVFIGMTPTKGLYAKNFAVTNIGITNEREIKINDKFSIPIKGSIIVNPYLENIFFTLTISLEAND